MRAPESQAASARAWTRLDLPAEATHSSARRRRLARRGPARFGLRRDMDNDKRRLIEGIGFLIAYGLTIPAANWMIGNVGAVCPPNSPCLIPVALGMMAPSGVVMIGIALVLRDLVQRRLGAGFSAAAVLAGAMLSALVAPAALALASGIAFLISEFADLAVYTPLARRRRWCSPRAWRFFCRSSPISPSIRRSPGVGW